MVRWNNKTYSGNIVNSTDEELTVLIHTAESLQDICMSLNDITEVIETTDTERAFAVTLAVSVRTVAQNAYYITFSTKMTFDQKISKTLQEQSDAIDALLVMLLEG